MTTEQAPEPINAPPGPTPPNSEEQRWNMCIHISQLAGYLLPVVGLILPIILWQVKKDDYPSSTAHAYVVINWILSAMIYLLVSGLLTIILIGFLGLFVVGILAIVFPIIGGVKASEGEVWEYPLSIRFLS